MPKPFVVYRRACDKSINPHGYEWVADLPGPGNVKLVSDSKTVLETELDRLDNLIKGASDGTQDAELAGQKAR